jgi:hypothetical protein
MSTNIPVYRAKKIDSTDHIIFELKVFAYGKIYAVVYDSHGVFVREDTDLINCKLIEIDVSTLAIHFPDMIDSEGTKIFASLSEDGKGGDVTTDIMNNNNESALIFIEYKINFKDDVFIRDFFELLSRSRLKVTGIQL